MSSTVGGNPVSSAAVSAILEVMDALHRDPGQAKEDGGPQDCVGETRFNQRAFEPRLAAEILKPGLLRRVGDAHMHHPAHARFPASLEQLQRVVHSGRVREVAMIEAHPIRIVEHRRAPQRLHQLRLIREVKWARLDLTAEGVGAID